MNPTTTLFPMPRWHEGIARLVDVGGVAPLRFNWSPTPLEADIRAMISDWRAVGGDLLGAMMNAIEQLPDDRKREFVERLRSIVAQGQVARR